MKRLTILSGNRPGVVAEVTSILAENNINIENIDAEGVNAKGVIHLIVDEYDIALQVLRGSGFKVVSEDAIVVRLQDEPGALAKVAVVFQEANVNIRSMHIMQRMEDEALVAIVTDSKERARELVEDVTV